MNIFRIDRISLQPLDCVIAHDSDHAAEMFIQAIQRGLRHRPMVSFSTSAWKSQRILRHPTVRRWAEEDKAGIAWQVDEGQAWLLECYDFDMD